MKNTLTVHIEIDDKAQAEATLAAIKQANTVRRAIYSEVRKQEVL